MTSRIFSVDQWMKDKWQIDAEPAERRKEWEAMSEWMISVVIPVFNEEAIIRHTYARLKTVMHPWRHELIFVDDGSTDHSREYLTALSVQDPAVKVVILSRNFGHQLAVSAGMRYASGDAVVLIDADLQDPPEVITRFVGMWEQGYDVVYGVRTQREGESWAKRVTAHVFYRLLRQLSDVSIPADVGDFRLMSRRVVDVLNNMPEAHRFIRGMASWAGFRQIGIAYIREPRTAGTSKYPWHKMWRFSLDAVTSFSVEPLRWVRRGALAVSAMAFLASLWLIRQKLMFPHSLVLGWTSVMVTMLWLGALQLGALGIFGEYLARVVEQGRQRPLYVVAETQNLGAEDSGSTVFSEVHNERERGEHHGQAVDFHRHTLL